MKLLSAVLVIIITFAVACQSKPPKAGAAVHGTDTGKFYPIGNFIKEQIRYVDLRNFTIYKITTINGKKDSAALTKDQFIEWASLFLDKDISSPQTAPQYRESVFNDLSTGSVTLNYTPINRGAVIQNIDVLLAAETNLVKRIFIKTVLERGDTTVTELYSWKTDKSFQINRSFTTKNGYNATELNYINWNEKPY